jgi:indole-3-glycerol phosphate synthase
MNAVLERILAVKRRELRELERSRLPAAPARRPVELARASGAPLALIAEVKRRSPSAGALSTALSVAQRAAAYERAGARVVSVLTDREFFDGAFEHLAEARRATALPILCKDFVIDPLQLDHARAFGADLVLLIVRCLEPHELGALIRAARERGLEPLVEIASEREATIALEQGASLVGVNARDLDTLAMDADRAARVLALLPEHVVRVHLSGLATPGDVARVAASGVDAALVGQALMREDDPEPLLRAMVFSGKKVAAAERRP